MVEFTERYLEASQQRGAEVDTAGAGAGAGGGDAMLRRRSAAYEAPTVREVHTKSSETETRASHDAKDPFLDLRIDMCDRAPAARPNTSGYSSAPAFSPSTKVAYSENARATAAAVHVNALAPSNLQHALRRCQSASTIRKKLLNAVEQSSSQMTHDQLALLRSIANSAAAKPTPKALLSRQLSSDTVATTSTNSNAGSRPSSAAGSQFPLHPHKSRYPDTFSSSSTAPMRARTLQQATHHDATAKHAQQQQLQRARIVGGFKSGAVQLEVELVERLNEIDRSKLNEKAATRFRACQKALDAVILQDEQYGRLLSKIRDEFNAYVDTVNRGSRESVEICVCACGGRGSSNQSNSDADFENALFRQENQSLKKTCASLQREIQVLQNSLQFATSDHHQASGSAGVKPNKFRLPEHEPDDHLSDDDLVGIQLLSPAPQRSLPLCRPPEIPPLNFAALSPYSEELDEEDDEEDDGDFGNGF